MASRPHILLILFRLFEKHLATIVAAQFQVAGIWQVKRPHFEHFSDKPIVPCHAQFGFTGHHSLVSPKNGKAVGVAPLIIKPYIVASPFPIDPPVFKAHIEAIVIGQYFLPGCGVQGGELPVFAHKSGRGWVCAVAGSAEEEDVNYFFACFHHCMIGWFRERL